MSYFSRLTDIVTCNLSEILANESDPHAAIAQIIREIEEGLKGAKRSVETASASARRLDNEMAEHKSRVEHWVADARKHLAAGNEQQARLALVRKQEVEDVIAGLDLQYKAALSTREHLTTTERAIDARLQEARRKQSQFEATTAAAASNVAEAIDTESTLTASDTRREQIDAELAALKRELNQEP